MEGIHLCVGIGIRSRCIDILSHYDLWWAQRTADDVAIPLVFIYNGEIDPRIDSSSGLFKEFEAERSVYITSSDLSLCTGYWLA